MSRLLITTFDEYAPAMSSTYRTHTHFETMLRMRFFVSGSICSRNYYHYYYGIKSVSKVSLAFRSMHRTERGELCPKFKIIEYR